MQKNTKKKIAPIVVAVIVILYVGPLVGVGLYAIGVAGAEGVKEVIPFLLAYALIGGAVIVGILRAMTQRLKEINGGEEDEASKY